LVMSFNLLQRMQRIGNFKMPMMGRTHGARRLCFRGKELLQQEAQYKRDSSLASFSPL